MQQHRLTSLQQGESVNISGLPAVVLLFSELYNLEQTELINQLRHVLPSCHCDLPQRDTEGSCASVLQQRCSCPQPTDPTCEGMRKRWSAEQR